jgi:hypothetical protein
MFLGPMPGLLREHVLRTGKRHSLPDCQDVRAIALRDGSGFCSTLTEDGAVWIYDASADPMIAELPDGPRKLLEIRLAAQNWPELATWLPQRSPGAADCRRCAGKGYRLSPVFDWPCSK